MCLCFQESDYFTDRGEFRVDSQGSSVLLNCLMYKLSYFRFGELKVSNMSHVSFTVGYIINVKICLNFLYLQYVDLHSYAFFTLKLCL